MTEFNPNVTQRVKAAVRKRIVKDWKSRLRDFSTIALGLGVALAGAWAVFPTDLKAFVPAQYVAWAIGALNAWGLVGKFILQGPLPEVDNPVDKPRAGG